MQERADLTIKMAQASGQSAATVSDQLTAVWNNFAKGGENLEHFADVMVRLGADTASSSDEIAEGLQKFASIGETVGLSYDNAAAALATITDRTRESADTVGTALKAIFARIQGLKFGDSLEDGTDLNKYSKALGIVGVSIKDGNGELRAMDDLIDDIGVKWKSLAADEQAALAQTVAGTRQYATFMALMNNYDFYKQNLESAQNSAGSLQEQADIYAQSWEAARDRVQAAMEDIYTKLINDDFFISLSNGLEKVLEGVSGFIDGLGGVKGMLTLISSIFMRIFASKMPQALNSLKENFMIAFGQGAKLMEKMQQDNAKDLAKIQNDPMTTSAQKIQAEGLSKISKMQAEYALKSKNMTEADKLQYQQKLKNIQATYDEIAAMEKSIKTAEKKVEKEKLKIISKHKQNAPTTQSKDARQVEIANLESQKATQEELAYVYADAGDGRWESALAKAYQLEEKINELKTQSVTISIDDVKLRKLLNDFDILKQKETQIDEEQGNIISQAGIWEKNAKAIDGNKQEAEQLIQTIKAYLQTLKQTGTAIDAAFDPKDINEVEEEFEKCGTNAEKLIEAINKIASAFGSGFSESINKKLEATRKQLEDAKVDVEGLEQASFTAGMAKNEQNAGKENSDNIDTDIPQSSLSGSQVYMEIGSALMGLQSAYTSVTSAVQVFGDESSTAADKIGAGISIITSSAFAINGLVKGYEAMTQWTKVKTLAQKLETAATKSDTTAKWANWVATNALNISIIAIVAIIVALCAVVWLVVKAFKAWQASTPEGQLKAAREESAALTEQLEATKNAAGELKDAFDNYDSIQQKIADCKEETDEWREAIQENNQAVLDLIDDYPELAKSVKVAANNQLVIDEDARKDIIAASNKKVAIAEMADNFGKQNVRQKEIDKIQSDQNKLNQYTNISKGNWREATDIERSYGAGIDKVTRTKKTGTYNVSTRTENTKMLVSDAKSLGDFVNELINKYGLNEAQDHATELLGDLTQKQVESVKELITSEQNLQTAIQENTLAQKLENQSTAAGILAGQEDYEKSDYQSNIAAIVGANISETSDEKITEYTDQASSKNAWWEFWKWGSDTAAKEDTWKKYTEYMQMDDAHGYHNLEYSLNDDGSVSYSYVDDNNDKHKDKKVTAGQIGKTLAAQDAYNENKTFGAAISKQMNSFSTQTEADLFTAAATKDNSYLSEETLKQDQKELNKIIDSMEVSKDILKQLNFGTDENGKLVKDAAKQFKTYQKELVASKKGFSELQKNGKTALSVIQAEFSKSEDGIVEWSDEAKQSAAEISKNLSAALGADADLGLDANFIAENQGIIDDFINGVEGSGIRLQEALQKDAIIDVTANINDDELKSKVENLHNNLITLANQDWEVGVGLNPEKEADFYAACQNMVDAAGMTAEQAQEYFGKMGYDVTFKTDKKKVSEIVWNKKYNNHYDDKGNLESTTVDAKAKTVISEVEVPVIKTITPNSSFGGNIKNINTGGGATTTAPEITNPGSTDKGSNSSKQKDKKSFNEKDKKEKQKYEDEYDRYRDITEAIDEYNDALSEISAQKDEAFGADKLAAMDKEKAKYNQLIAKQKDYITAISGVDGKGGYLAIDQAELAKYGGQFDEEGRLTNYHELTQGWLNDVNAATDKYNSTMASITETFNNSARDDAAEEVYNNAKERAENDYELATKENDKRKEALDKWQETYDLNEEQIQQLNDYYRELRSFNYEQLEHKIEMRVELNESDLSDIEHQLSRLSETDYTKSAERIALISKNATTYKLMADDQKRFIEELKAQYAAGDINQEDFIAGLKEAKDAILEAETQIREGIVAVGDELRNAFSLAAEQLDKVYEKIDRRLDFADFYKDISAIINGEADYDILNSMIDAQTDAMEIKVDGLINERDALIRKQTKLYADLAEATTAEKKAQIRETLDEVETRIADTNSKIQSGIKSLAEYAQEEFETAIAAIAKAAEEQLLKRTGLSTLEAMLEHIDNLHTAQNLVLTTTNKIYETNKLINQAEKDINATTNKRAQQAYQEYINKVKQKQEQNEMTEFELDLLTAEYEITKAQIALEEAQNAKDTVRLTRDSEGNYGYVYTANQDKVSDAQQALEDAKNNAYNVSKDMLDEMSSAWVENEQAVKDALTELAQEYAKGNIDIDEYEQRRNEIIASYRAEAERINKNYYLALDSMTEYSYKTDEDYTTQRVQRMSEYDTFVETINENMGDAAEDYQGRLETVAEKVEKAYGNEEDAISYVRDAAEDYGKELDILIPQMETNLTRAIGEATSAWDEYCKKLREVIELSNMVSGDVHDTVLKGTYEDNYSQQIQNLIEAGETYNSSDVQKLLRYRWNELGGVDDTNYQELMDSYTGSHSDSQYILWQWLRDYKVENTDWMERIQEAILNGASLSKVQWMIDVRDEKLLSQGKRATSLQEVKDWMTEQGIAFASGGYTGDWGPSGKLAVLHEKELVLNANDTANILASVDIIREISRSLDNSALWAMLGMGQLNAATIGSVGGDTLQQQVEIHADFPNVTDHNEIEMAIDNLINAASQYAYRG